MTFRLSGSKEVKWVEGGTSVEDIDIIYSFGPLTRNILQIKTIPIITHS